MHPKMNSGVLFFACYLQGILAAKEVCRHLITESGWNLECSTYDVKYTANTEVEFTCKEFTSPYISDMFHTFNISSIQTFHMIECPVPNTTFGDILSGVNVPRLQYDVYKHTIDLHNETFNGLPNIRELILNVKLNNISPDIFKQLPQLTSLTISTNLTSIPGTLFSEVVSLQSLSLRGNNFKTLPECLFSGLPNLTVLFLDENHLEELPTRIFSTLPQLEKLSLQKNFLKTCPPLQLINLTKLTYFSLSENNITDLSEDFFQGNTNLQSLDIGVNPTWKQLPPSLLKNLSSLTEVIIRGCHFVVIPDEFFSYSHNLQKIDMQDNRITSVSSKLFCSNTHLKEIYMSYCDSKVIAADAFANLSELQTLWLGYNNFNYFPEDLFEKNINLRYLDLSGQKNITSLPANLFSKLVNLEHLLLKINLLRTFSGLMPFGPGTKLQSIDLSYNQLYSTPIINWDVYDKVTSLNLDDNNFDQFSLPIMKSSYVNISVMTSHIETVNVDYLSQFNEKTIPSIPSRKMTFFFSHNNFTCDCKMLAFAEFINNSLKANAPKLYSIYFPDADQLICEKPAEVVNRKLTSLDKRDFVCVVNESCPFPCTCFTRAFDGATVVNCSYLGLREAPKFLPPNTTELYLENNSLDNLNNLAWMNLTYLDVSNNWLQSEEWEIPAKITELHLHGNNLTWIPNSVLQFINRNTTVKISLGNNPFPCNCSMQALKKLMLLKANAFLDLTSIFCTVARPNSTLKLLVDIQDNELCPVHGPSQSLMITIVIFCVIIMVILPFVLVLYYKNKQIVVAFLYTRLYCIFSIIFNEEEMDEDKEFDAFISYSSYNEDIAQMLLDELENKDIFKLCIHGRNWMPGNLIIDNIAHSVQKSRRTILVISKQFLESIWFQVEFHTAYYQMLEDKIDRLIIIINGDLPEKSLLDKDLQVLLSTKTYLIWGEQWFWEKLRYAMPHRRKPKVLEKEKLKPIKA